MDVREKFLTPLSFYFAMMLGSGEEKKRYKRV